VDEIDVKTGRIVRHAQVLDKSYFDSRRGPTHNTIEIYNDIDIGHVQLKKSPIQGPATREQLQGAGGTLNYNPVMHFHGVEGEPWLRSQLAQHHRYAADQFQRMLAEAEYRLNRSRFDGAQPV